MEWSSPEASSFNWEVVVSAELARSRHRGARLAALMISSAPNGGDQSAKHQSAEEGGKAQRVATTTLDPIFAGSVTCRFNPLF